MSRYISHRHKSRRKLWRSYRHDKGVKRKFNPYTGISARKLYRKIRRGAAKTPFQMQCLENLMSHQVRHIVINLGFGKAGNE